MSKFWFLSSKIVSKFKFKGQSSVKIQVKRSKFFKIQSKFKFKVQNSGQKVKIIQNSVKILVKRLKWCGNIGF